MSGVERNTRPTSPTLNDDLVERVARGIDPSAWQRRDGLLKLRDEPPDEMVGRMDRHVAACERLAEAAVAPSLEQARAALSASGQQERVTLATEEEAAVKNVDGMDAIEVLAGDASGAEGVGQVHEGSGYYAERVIRRAIKQGTLVVTRAALENAQTARASLTNGEISGG